MGGLPSDKATYSLKRRRTYGRGDMAVSFVFVACLAVLAPPILAAELSKGLELAEAISTRAVESMKNDMSINFLEAALLQATISPSGEFEGSDLSNYCSSPGEGECPWPTYSLMDAEGVLHSCTVYEEPPGALELNRKTSSRRDVATALDRLNGRCAMLTQNYWNYEWCHRETIKQFHHVDDESVTVISLGKYKRTEVKRINVADTEANAAGKTGLSNWLSRVLKRKRKDNSPQGIEGETPSAVEDYSGVDLSQVSAVLDFYEDGSICKETRKPRQAQVLITCCAYGSITFPPVLLVSIEEVTICNYLLRVCSSELCPEPASGDGQSTDHGRLIGSGDSHSPSRATTSGVMEILDSLEACFPTMHVDYWSYQVCLSKGIQQYHVDLDTNPEGKQFIRDSVHYSLGEFNQLAVEDNGESLIGEAEDGKPAIIVEFEGGTECDLTGVLRSSTVYLKCGVEQELKEIVEDRTCHYKIEAESPLLCRHKRLIQKKEPTRKVKCVVEGESEPETNEGEYRSTTQGSGRT